MTGEISYDPEEFEVSVEGKITSVLFLGNAYREYCSCSNKHRPNSLQRFVRGWLDAHICTTCLVQWNQETLTAISQLFGHRWKGARLHFRETWLDEDDMEHDDGNPMSVEQPAGRLAWATRRLGFVRCLACSAVISCPECVGRPFLPTMSTLLPGCRFRSMGTFSKERSLCLGHVA